MLHRLYSRRSLVMQGIGASVVALVILPAAPAAAGAHLPPVSEQVSLGSNPWGITGTCNATLAGYVPGNDVNTDVTYWLQGNSTSFGIGTSTHVSCWIEGASGTCVEAPSADSPGYCTGYAIMTIPTWVTHVSLCISVSESFPGTSPTDPPGSGGGSNCN